MIHQSSQHTQDNSLRTTTWKARNWSTTIAPAWADVGMAALKNVEHAGHDGRMSVFEECASLAQPQFCIFGPL